ncbi:hypothetical protein [Nocardia crassostreae]|uniref:hypothetical protein n=1 Tax=Nocardia crassostreae TaxID=53428 RepID=UPI0012F78AA7|nr:hypothetical protein [Nocardia crassostreae]
MGVGGIRGAAVGEGVGGAVGAAGYVADSVEAREDGFQTACAAGGGGDEEVAGEGSGEFEGVGGGFVDHGVYGGARVGGGYDQAGAEVGHSAEVFGGVGHVVGVGRVDRADELDHAG